MSAGGRSQGQGDAHFGLGGGTVTVSRVFVRWPDGVEGNLIAPPLNTVVDVEYPMEIEEEKPSPAQQVQSTSFSSDTGCNLECLKVWVIIPSNGDDE